TLKLIHSINSVVTIVDVSSNLNNPNVQDLLHFADEIFICVEPDPVKIDWLSTVTVEGKKASHQRIENEIMELLKELEEKEGIEYQFITTKFTNVINFKEWEQCLEKEPLCYFPSFPYEVLIRNVWDSKILYDNEE